MTKTGRQLMVSPVFFLKEMTTFFSHRLLQSADLFLAVGRHLTMHSHLRRRRFIQYSF